MAKMTVRRPFVGQNVIEDLDPANPKEALEARNVDLSDGTIRKARGFTELHALTGRVRGIYEWHRADGAILYAIVAGTALHVIDASSGDRTEVDATAFTSSTRPVSFLAFFDKLYMTDGDGPPKVTDGTAVYDVLLAAPTQLYGAIAAPTFFGNTNTWHGKAVFYVTWYSPEFGIESPAFEETLDWDWGETVAFHFPSADAPDARFTRMRVYIRRIDFTEMQFAQLVKPHIFYDGGPGLLKGLPLDTDLEISTFQITNKDGWYTPDIVPMVADNSSWRFKFLAAHSGVLLASGFEDGGTAYPSRLYYTAVNRPWDFTHFVTVGAEQDGDAIQAIIAGQGFARIYKNRSIHFFSGQDAEDFYSTVQVPSIGARSHFGIVGVGTTDFFFSNGAIYSYSGQGQPLDISLPIRDVLIDRAAHLDDHIVGWHDTRRRSVSWAFASSGASDLDTVVSYFYENSQRSGRQSWAVETKALLTFAREIFTATQQVVVFGQSDGSYAEVGGTLQAGAVFVMRWETQRIDGGQPFRRKAWSFLQVEIAPKDDGSTLSIRAKLDQDEHEHPIAVVGQSKSHIELPVKLSSRDIRLVFEHSGDGECEIQGFQLVAEEAERLR